MDINALFKISYGLYIVSSRKDGKVNGQIVNSVFQVTAEPPQIAVCVNKQNLTHEYIDASKVFAVSVLTTRAAMPFIGLFGFRSGREIDKFKEVKYRFGKTGAPLVTENTNAVLECEVVGRMDAGSHTIFVGKLVGAETLNNDEVMTYEYYHRELKGKVPKTATTYIDEKKTAGVAAKQAVKYQCRVCGYVYDPEKGDPGSGIKPGTPFEDLPGNWVCPVCGAGKDKFERMD